jgi:hypothetical protein
MKLFGSVPANRRRATLAVGLAAFAVVCVASGLTAMSAPSQTPPAQTPAPAQQADQMKFSADAELIFMQIAADKTADFEEVMGKVKAALAKSDKPDRKAQASHWNLFKTDSGPMNGLVVYVMVLNPVSKDQTYDPMKILQEGGATPEELQTLYTKLSGSLKMINLSGLNKVLDMGGSGN